MDDINIKIPVFKTKTEEEEIALFNIDREQMVDNALTKINAYQCSESNKITLDNSMKNYTNEIVQISAQKKDMHQSPVLFIRMSAHKTNLNDGYIETDEKIPVTKDVKIGSDHYYIVMYPMVIKGRNLYRRYWNVFLYDDPNKESQEFIKIAKSMIKEVLKLKISNLKRKDFVEELKQISKCKISATFQTVEFINNQHDAEFKEHIIEGKIFSKKMIEYKDMSYDNVDKLINSDEDITIKRKIFNIFTGKKEYKVSKTIKKDIGKAKEKYNLLIESLFNENISITEEEFSNKMYNEDFIIEKIENVVVNYMS